MFQDSSSKLRDADFGLDSDFKPSPGRADPRSWLARMAFIYQVRVSGPCLVAEKTSAVPTIWAKCFALTTQKFNKGRTKPNLSPNGDRSGYKFRSVQGRGQTFFGETSWNGTSIAAWSRCLCQIGFVGARGI